jgi:hypothetical protein
VLFVTIGGRVSFGLRYYENSNWVLCLAWSFQLVWIGLDWIGGCILFMEACNTDGDFNSWWAFQEGMCTHQLQISD